MSTGLLAGITFFIVFIGMILIHEIGHFLAARLMKIEVEEFGFGIPPRMLTLFTWRGIKVTLNWLPLGGFVRLKGEDDPSVVGGMAAAKPWRRIVVLLAGVTMNLLTAVVTYTILFSQVGIPDQKSVVITSLEPGAPAALAGMEIGDLVLSINNQEIMNIDVLIDLTRQNLGKPVYLMLERNEQVMEIMVTPRTEWPEDSGPMGVGISNPFILPKSWFSTLPASFQATGRDIGNLLSLPGKLIAGTVSPEQGQLLGPRSIWNIFQAAVASDLESRQDNVSGESQPTYYTLLVIIALSISVGTINILPIPAVDGGRILFTLPELIFHRAIPSKYQLAVNGTAFIILIALMGYFYIKDFIDPITITLP